ncbi:MAG: S24/S26 family peptidase [Verrucomicrobiota bacterium]|nr:S24/S26 family peptidase [Verrucomicrobiota bacterium]
MALIAMTGCETLENTDTRSTLSPQATRRAAQVVSEGAPGRFAGNGHGRSMVPIYAEGTVVVIQSTDYNKLEKGMVVAYQDKFGAVVVHQLLEKQGSAWIAKGFGNDMIDREPVTRKNLLGVVYATFTPNQAPAK